MKTKKRQIVSLALTAIMAGSFGIACSDSNSDSKEPDRNWGTDGGLRSCDNILFGDTIGNGDQEIVFTGKQTIKAGTYHLAGWVYVTEGAELTIEPGTIIKGDKQTKAALIVERGGKLIADGTAKEPIVFTSEESKGNRKPGDWGGVILCGNARNNQTEMQIEGGPRTKHGGQNDADNSGILRYVRIEFAGYPFATDKEINGLTFGSVGSGTVVDHIQVSYSNDDSYEWFGGAVNCNHLVAYKGWDDEFDTDNGFSGKVQFLLSVRDSKIADVSQSNGFESDNAADGGSVSPYTTAVFSNVTFVGPRVDPSFVNNADYINGGSVYPNNGSSLGKFQAAMHIRRNSRLNCFNSLAIGYPIGLILDNEKGNTQAAATAGTLNLQNVWMAEMEILGSDYNKQYKDSLVLTYKPELTFDKDAKESFSSTWFKAQSGNKVVSDVATLNLTGASTKVGVDYMPQSGSPLIGAASFTNAKLASGFQSVNYVGAFAAGDTWLNDWTNFDPQNTDY